jgi:hypothetical protein
MSHISRKLDKLLKKSNSSFGSKTSISNPLSGKGVNLVEQPGSRMNQTKLEKERLMNQIARSNDGLFIESSFNRFYEYVSIKTKSIRI